MKKRATPKKNARDAVNIFTDAYALKWRSIIMANLPKELRTEMIQVKTTGNVFFNCPHCAQKVFMADATKASNFELVAQLRAKDKWINELLVEVEVLQQALGALPEEIPEDNFECPQCGSADKSCGFGTPSGCFLN